MYDTHWYKSGLHDGHVILRSFPPVSLVFRHALIKRCHQGTWEVDGFIIHITLQAAPGRWDANKPNSSILRMDVVQTSTWKWTTNVINNLHTNLVDFEWCGKPWSGEEIRLFQSIVVHHRSRMIKINDAVKPSPRARTRCYIYYLLTGCKGRTRKYKPKVFHTARACESCLENQGLVFLGTARAPS